MIVIAVRCQENTSTYYADPTETITNLAISHQEAGITQNMNNVQAFEVVNATSQIKFGHFWHKSFRHLVLHPTLQHLQP